MTGKRKKPQGRPVLLTQPFPGSDDPRTTYGDRIIAAIRQGAYMDDAAKAAGIDPATFYRWMGRGRDALSVAEETREDPEHPLLDLVPEGERIYCEFCQRVEKARGEATVANIATVRAAAQGRLPEVEEITYGPDGQIEKRVVKRQLPAWQAAAWWLERTQPEKFGRRIGVAGGEGGERKTFAQLMDALSEESRDA